MCRRAFDRYLGGAPASILDLGCGTGRVSGPFAQEGIDAWGVDASADMLAYARAQWPSLRTVQGDMRTLDLARTLDAILCLGSVIMHALTPDDVDATFESLARHAHVGTLLLLDMDNVPAMLAKGTSYDTQTTLDSPLSVTITSRYTIDADKRLVQRLRRWSFENEAPVEEHGLFRYFEVDELHETLTRSGFETLGTFDNRRFRESDLRGPRIYVTARKP